MNPYNNDFINHCNIMMNNQLNEISKEYCEKIKNVNFVYMKQLNELNKMEFGAVYLNLANNIRNDYNINCIKITNEFLMKKLEIENYWKNYIENNLKVQQTTYIHNPITDLQNLVNSIYQNTNNNTNTSTTTTTNAQSSVAVPPAPKVNFKLTKTVKESSVATPKPEKVFLELDRTQPGINFITNLNVKRNPHLPMLPTGKKVQTIAENALRVKFIEDLQNGKIEGTKEYKDTTNECANILLEISGNKKNKRDEVNENDSSKKRKIYEKKEGEINEIVHHLIEIMERNEE